MRRGSGTRARDVGGRGAHRPAVFRSLRLRMALSHGAVLAVILLALGGIGQALLARALDRAATTDVVAVAHQAVDRLVEAGDATNPPDSDTPSRSGIRVGVFLPSGRPVDGDERTPAWLRPSRQTVVDLVVRGEPVRAATLPAVVNGRLLARVVAAESLVAEQGLVHRVRLLLVFGGFAAVAASMLAGWALAGRAARPVRRAYAVQSSFAADASHELRTPLALVRQAVEVLAERDRELGGQALEEIDYLTALTERLLLLARADSGSLSASTERLDVAEVCREAARRARGAHALRLDLEGTDGVAALGDRVATEAALDALLENVAMHGGGSATLRWRVDRDRAILEVADHGPGLSVQERDAAFRRFYRADAARAREDGGAGLGLAIAQALVTAQRGTLRLAETRGGGLTARVELRLAAVLAGVPAASSFAR